MCTPKRKRVSLNVPAWVQQAWSQNDKTEMAQLLMDSNWNKDRFNPSYKTTMIFSFSPLILLKKVGTWCKGCLHFAAGAGRQAKEEHEGCGR